MRRIRLIYRDPRVDSLIKKQIQINEVTTRESRRNIPGFRIQVANSNDSNEIFTIKTKIYQFISGIETLSYLPAAKL